MSLTATVRAADGYETGGRVRFSAPGWEQTVYLDDGVASVTLPGTLVPGEQAVRAEYLGHDVPDRVAGQPSRSRSCGPGPPRAPRSAAPSRRRCR